MLIDGKIAFVTGGANGIGLALVETLLKRGACVVSVDVAPGTANSLLQSQRSKFGKIFGMDKILMIRADCGSTEALGHAFQTALQTFGRVDIVVNNAALPETGGDFQTTCRTHHVEEVLAVDLLAVVEGTRLAVQHMSERRGGVVINVASMGGLLPMPFSVVYCAAKHGVIGLTRSLYHLADPRLGGVRVNCVAPSFVETAMVLDHVEQSAGFKRAVQQQNALLQPSDIVEAILSLIEDDSKAGAVLRVVSPPKSAKGTPEQLHKLKFSYQAYPSWQQVPVLPPLMGEGRKSKL